MNLIQTLREKSQAKKKKEIQRQAEEAITLSDFEGCIFIAYDGVPILPIEKQWTSEETIRELAILRQNYINIKIKQQCS